MKSLEVVQDESTTSVIRTTFIFVFNELLVHVVPTENFK